MARLSCLPAMPRFPPPLPSSNIHRGTVDRGRAIFEIELFAKRIQREYSGLPKFPSRYIGLAGLDPRPTNTLPYSNSRVKAPISECLRNDTLIKIMTKAAVCDGCLLSRCCRIALAAGPKDKKNEQKHQKIYPMVSCSEASPIMRNY